ncbi:MAG: glycosyltransferase [Brumimicrobium sp.]|nr:glycosyltransferase [Brumimicrobium sp.]
MNNNKNLAFWGTEAPPYGGMSVHIQRLTQYLQNKEWKVIQYNFKNDKRDKDYIINVPNLLIWYLGLWFRKSPKIHYVITTRGKIRFLASLLTLKRKKVILRVGGESLKKAINNGGLDQLLNIWSLKLCSAFIGVNKDICLLAQQYTDSDKIHHIPGFIPPQNLREDAPKEINSFFKTDALKLVVTGQVFGKSEKDIYGLYHFIDTLSVLKEKAFNFKAIIVVYGNTKSNFDMNLNMFTNYLHKYELKDEVLIYINTDELWPIIKMSDVFIRPSISDGDANSIREALYLGKMVIASDCVPRPHHCILYPNLDEIVLANEISKLELKGKEREKEDGNQKKIERLLENLVSIRR